MNLGGLFARGAILKAQIKKTPCKRCGLHFDHSKNKECPHCGNLDQKGLEHLLEQQNVEKQGNKSLGSMFLIVAIILVVLVLLVGGV